jgi:membrane fusion protein, multidrug efflux system
MKLHSQIIILAILGAIGYGGWTYRDNIPFLGQQEETENARRSGGRPVPVIAAKAIRRDLPNSVAAVGTLEANQSVNLTTRVTAKIKKLSFLDGATVTAGTELVRLDDTEPRAELAESQAELDNSRKLYQRALKLYKSGNVPKARVDLLLSELQVVQARISADRARLADYVINAPFTGILGFREMSAGALVRPGDLITTLDDVQTLKLDFGLPEALLANIKVGQPFTTTSVAFTDQVFEGRVVTIAARVDPVTRIVKVRGEVPNSEKLLKPGMFLSVSLQTGMQKAALLIPEQAVFVSPAGSFVFAVQDEKAKRQQVKLGARRKGWVQVISGLEEGTVVVTEGVQKVRDGQKLKVTLEETVFSAAMTKGEAAR